MFTSFIHQLIAWSPRAKRHRIFHLVGLVIGLGVASPVWADVAFEASEPVTERAFVNPAAFTDGSEEAWVKVAFDEDLKSAAWSPRGVCSRIARAGRRAMIPAMLAACDPVSAPVELPSEVVVVQVYDARTGAWEKGLVGDLEVGDEVLHQGHLLRLASDGVEDRGFAEVGQLSGADVTWTVDAVWSVPDGDDWVLVLGDVGAGHWRLAELTVGERFAFGGRVFETDVVDGELAVRATERVVAEVVQTFKRMVVDEVIDLQVAFPDGEKAVITGTHEHPFYVPALDLYMPLGELEPGTILQTDGGGEAVVVELTRREGEFEVFNIEVAEAHNYFVRGAGFEGPGVLVHNKPMKPPLTKSQQKSIDSLRQRATEHRQKLSDFKANPDAFDNKGFLKNAPSDKVRQKIIDGRVKHLETEIKTFDDNVRKVFQEAVDTVNAVD